MGGRWCYKCTRNRLFIKDVNVCMPLVKPNTRSALSKSVISPFTNSNNITYRVQLSWRGTSKRNTHIKNYLSHSCFPFTNKTKYCLAWPPSCCSSYVLLCVLFMFCSSYLLLYINFSVSKFLFYIVFFLEIGFLVLLSSPLQ